MKKYFLIFNLLYLSIQFRAFDYYSHKKGTQLDILAGPISSYSSAISYRYKSLVICEASNIKRKQDTFSELISGETFYTTGYKTKILENSQCQLLCYNGFYQKTIDRIKKYINENYYLTWYLDKLPAGWIRKNNKGETKINYSKGIPIGYIKKDGNTSKYYIYNHLSFHILINKVDKDIYNIVGFNIEPKSIKHPKNTSTLKCDGDLEEQELVYDMHFSYDVIYERSELTFASRWDHYKPSSRKIHWVGIITSNSLIICISVILGIILKKTIRKDIQENKNDDEVHSIIDFGWKQLGNEVFRPPYRNPMLLSIFLGTGVQLLSMIFIVIAISLSFFYYPVQRGFLINIGLILFIFMGIPGGYTSCKIYKFFNGRNWVANCLLNCILFPSTIIIIYIIIHVLLFIENANISITIKDVLNLFVLWLFCISPMIIIGSFLGIKSKKIEIPPFCKPNLVPATIPKKPCCLHYRYISIVSGLISFATIAVELNYVMSALWKHEIYFMAIFLFVSFTCFITVSVELSIIFVFYNLCYGDYNWWWKSFLVGGSPIFYFILYSIFYYFFILKVRRFVAIVVYFSTMGIISIIAFLICGSISTLFCITFLIRLYTKMNESI